MQLANRLWPRLAFLFTLLLALLPARAAEPAPPADTFRIVTSFYPLYIHTLNIAGGIPGVQVRNLTRPTTGCLHDYQLRPDELVALAQADLFVINGLGMESFLDKATSRFPALRVLDASAGFAMPPAPGAAADPDHDHDHNHQPGAAKNCDHDHPPERGINPHLWLAPTGAMHQVRVIRDGLIKADPPHAARYQANADAYLAQLDALRQRLHRELAGLQGRKIVTLHEAFPHFAREFGLEIVAVIAREPGSEPSARDLAELTKLIRARRVDAIFTEPQYPAKAAATLGRETGVGVFALDSAVTGPDSPAAYLRIMDGNLAVLRAALPATRGGEQ